MRRALIFTCLWLATALAYAGTQADQSDEQIAKAKTAIKVLAGTLKTELQTAMQSGGPTAAIEVCNTRAMVLTQQVASEMNMQLARVSLRNRNPANAANQWQKEVLQDFERQHAQGKDAGSLVWTDTVEIDGVREFRLMKAIPTAGVCLTCHGSQLPGEVSQTLSELYPADLATGFSEGDIRGAFVVTRKLAD